MSFGMGDSHLFRGTSYVSLTTHVGQTLIYLQMFSKFIAINDARKH